MGAKYTIEVEDKPFELLSKDGFTSEKLFRVKGFNSLVFDWNGLNMLTPYTEPDLEQVRKEAYEEGYNAGFGRKIDASYQEGLADAWECARKIIHMPEGDLLNIFTECYSAVCTALQVLLKYDASEAIEKIRQYEQEQEIKVGDEVENTQTGVKFIVTHLWENNRGEQGVSGFNQKCSAFSTTLSLVVKTGRHFPEIAVVLEKMREV